LAEPLLPTNTEKKLQHFYIAEEQSIYLLNHKDATKLKQWVELCQQQLRQLGYSQIALLGKGAYGFVFSAKILLTVDFPEPIIPTK